MNTAEQVRYVSEGVCKGVAGELTFGCSEWRGEEGKAGGHEGWDQRPGAEAAEMCCSFIMGVLCPAFSNWCFILRQSKAVMGTPLLSGKTVVPIVFLFSFWTLAPCQCFLKPGSFSLSLNFECCRSHLFLKSCHRGPQGGPTSLTLSHLSHTLLEGREGSLNSKSTLPIRDHQIQNQNNVDSMDFYLWSNATYLLPDFLNFILIKAF